MMHYGKFLNMPIWYFLTVTKQWDWKWSYVCVNSQIPIWKWFLSAKPSYTSLSIRMCHVHTCFILVNILNNSSLSVLTLPNYILSIPLPVTWLPIKISNLAHNYYLCSDFAYFFATKPGLRHVNGESCSDWAPPIPNTSVVISAAKPSHCL